MGIQSVLRLLWQILTETLCPLRAAHPSLTTAHVRSVALCDGEEEAKMKTHFFLLRNVIIYILCW